MWSFLLNPNRELHLKDYLTAALLLVLYVGMFFEEARYSLFGVRTEGTIVTSEVVTRKEHQRRVFTYEFDDAGTTRVGQGGGSMVGDYPVGRTLVVQYIPGTASSRLAGLLGWLPRFTFVAVCGAILLWLVWALHDIGRPFGK